MQNLYAVSSDTGNLTVIAISPFFSVVNEFHLHPGYVEKVLYVLFVVYCCI